MTQAQYYGCMVVKQVGRGQGSKTDGWPYRVAPCLTRQASWHMQHAPWPSHP